MIPKIIHCVWLGKGEKNERAKLCIESWKKLLPDYEIIEWNEENFDVNCNNWCKESYKNKKYAFTSDYVRLWALYNYGGIYMDTDVEVYKPLDKFLTEKGFTGFEAVNYPSTATLGAEKGNPVIKKMMEWYENHDFILYDDWRDYIKNERTSTCVQSNILSELGIDRKRNEIQRIENFTVYPTNYFFTKDEGYTYHSFNGSW